MEIKKQKIGRESQATLLLSGVLLAVLVILQLVKRDFELWWHIATTAGIFVLGISNSLRLHRWKRRHRGFHFSRASKTQRMIPAILFLVCVILAVLVTIFTARSSGYPLNIFFVAVNGIAIGLAFPMIFLYEYKDVTGWE